MQRLTGKTNDSLKSYEEALALMREIEPGVRFPRPGLGQSGGKFFPGLGKAGPGKSDSDRNVPRSAWSGLLGLRTARALESVGDIHLENGDYVEAANSFQESIAVCREIPESASNVDLQDRIAKVIAKLGGVYLVLGNRVDAQLQFIEALRIRERLSRKDATNLIWKLDIAEGYIDLGSATDLEIAGANLTALSYYRKAIDLLQTIEPTEADLLDRRDRLNLRVESRLAEVLQ